VKKPREKVYMPFITAKVCYDVLGIKKGLRGSVVKMKKEDKK
jgi:hypothetical protein